MKKYDKGVLKQVEDLAALQFLPAQVALSVGIKKQEFQHALLNEDNPLYLAFHRGRLISEAEVRRAVLTQAKQGSTPAQKQMMELAKNNQKESESSDKNTARSSDNDTAGNDIDFGDLNYED